MPKHEPKPKVINTFGLFDTFRSAIPTFMISFIFYLNLLKICKKKLSPIISTFPLIILLRPFVRLQSPVMAETVWLQNLLLLPE